MTQHASTELDTVIIGGSVAGVGVADELRRLGHDRPITLLDAQSHLPYDRPPLSKGVLTGEIAPEHLSFHDAEHYRSSGIELRLGVRVERLDAATRTIELETGETLRARTIVLATGARARPMRQDAEHVHLLRERNDALELHAALSVASRVVIIGGGFIGAEIASSATAIGVAATLVELAARPFEAITGPEVAELMLELHRRAGVDIRCGVTADRVARSVDGYTVSLGDGSAVSADAVVAGLGAVPEIEWLAGSGLEIDDGVVCDFSGRTSFPGVYAAGDAARWSAGDSPARRHEHWTSAREQGRIVAHTIIGTPGPRWEDTIPYVWSDQHGARLQMIGAPATSDAVEVVQHDEQTGAFLALYGRDGELAGAVGCNRAGAITKQRLLLGSKATFTAALDAFAPGAISPRS